MTTPPRTMEDVCLPAAFRAGIFAGLLLAAAGCRTGTVYQASALPAQFQAPLVANPQTFDLSRLAQAPGRSDLLHPGDLLEVAITTGLEGDADSHWHIRIDEQGQVQVPLVGSVTVAGLELPEAERLIYDASIQRGQFVNPNVSVLLVQRRTNRVAVVGAVNQPGVKALPPAASDLFHALMEAGGLSEDAEMLVEIRHPGADAAGQPGGMSLAGFRPQGRSPLAPPVVRVALEQVAAGAVGDFHVEDGSSVVVSRRPKEFIQVMGLVKKSDQFEIKPGQELRLLDALALANGRSMEIADKVRIIRRTPASPTPVIIEASVRRAKADGNENLRLAAGDVVSVEETPVTLVVGTIRDFVRFGFTSAIPGF